MKAKIVVIAGVAALFNFGPALAQVGTADGTSALQLPSEQSPSGTSGNSSTHDSLPSSSGSSSIHEGSAMSRDSSGMSGEVQGSSGYAGEAQGAFGPSGSRYSDPAEDGRSSSMISRGDQSETHTWASERLYFGD